MFPTLKNSHIDIYFEDESKITVSTESVSAAYAGSSAAKNCLLMEGNPITKGHFSFEKEYIKYTPSAIITTNELGLSTTFETIAAMHPESGLDILIKEQLEHADNPFWPFFDED